MPHPVFYSCWKFFTDKIIGLALLILTLPLILIIACVIKLTSKGNVFFLQKRGGLNQKPFRILKFRTMVREAAEDESAPQATRRDARITPVGILLRRTSLDELPQLFNVVKGDMSLVGPRPHALHHDQQFANRCATYNLRFRVKPGLTGWAQVNGFRGLILSDEDIEKRTALDNAFIDHWSPWLEIKILLRTLIAPLWSPNAH